MSIYMTSDWHLWHNKFFIYEQRGFDYVEEMNDCIINNYCSIIRPDDEVYILGDVLLGGQESLTKAIPILSKLPGKIHLVRGNHDTNQRWQIYQENCAWNLIEAKNSIYLDHKGYHFYLSHYPAITSNHDYQKPLRSRLLNICGHTHTGNAWKDSDKGYIYHVEVDAHSCMPVNLDTIIESFKKKF